MANYKEIYTNLAYLEDFTHNGTMSGFEVASWYVVKSYRTIIALVNLKTKQGYITKDKYSSTTSRQTNLVKKAFDYSYRVTEIKYLDEKGLLSVFHEV